MRIGIDAIRQRVSAASVGLFSAPFLPSGLIRLTVFLMFTDLMVILLGQPANYWLDRTRAESGFPALQSVLDSGILTFVFAGLLYLVLLATVLALFTRIAALILWLPVGFLHLSHILLWVTDNAILPIIPDLAGWLHIAVYIIAVLVLGVILLVVFFKSRRPVTANLFLRKNVQVGFLAVWGLILAGLVAANALQPHREGWQPIHPRHSPGPRTNSAIVYDSARNRAVFVGGISDWLGTPWMYENDTWEWDGSDWIEKLPATVPYPRASQAMAYDEIRGVVVMFSGRDKNETTLTSDTLLWDGTNWEYVATDLAPPPRCEAQMFFNRETGTIILAGGITRSKPDQKWEILKDTWEWDGERWREISAPPQRFTITNTCAVYDPIQGRGIVFDYDGWLAWADGKWSRLECLSNPPDRNGTAIAVDPTSGKILLFGGINDDVKLHDTWLWQDDTWKEIPSALTPSPRSEHRMFFDPVRNSFILYGGYGTDIIGDMWEYALP